MSKDELYQLNTKQPMTCTETGFLFKTLTCSWKQQLTRHHRFQYEAQPQCATEMLFVRRAFYKAIYSFLYARSSMSPSLSLSFSILHISLFHCIHRSGPVCVGFSMQYESICLHWRKIIAKQTNHLCHIEQASSPGAWQLDSYRNEGQSNTEGNRERKEGEERRKTEEVQT